MQSQVGLRKHYKQSYWRLRDSSRAISNPKRWCESAALNMSANLENSTVATGLEKVSFHSNPKERQCQRMFKLLHNCSQCVRWLKLMLKILQPRLQQYVNCELPDVQAGFRKGRETRDQTANICWIIGKAREFQKNTCFICQSLWLCGSPHTV